MKPALQLSLVIPELNEPDNRHRHLLSLAAQREDGLTIDVIVVDNGSAEMQHAARAGFADVRLEREPIPGPRLRAQLQRRAGPGGSVGLHRFARVALPASASTSRG